MNRSILQYAKNLIRRRKFGTAIQLLQGAEKDYKGSFEFYRMLGMCCLYVGDIDHASYYYSLARSIKIQDAELYIGQAAIFLHRGEVENALPYYLEVEKLSPGNKIASEALEFLKENSDRVKVRTRLLELIQTGRIEHFYPPLGTNPDLVRNAIVTGLLLGLCISVGIIIGGGHVRPVKEKRVSQDRHKQNIENLALTEAEMKNPSDKNSDSMQVEFYLTDKEINKAYEDARNYAASHRDNAALVEINRINSSNADALVKAKAETLKSTLFPEKVGFDNLKDNYSYEEVENDPVLYSGCYVIWDGRIANPKIMENGFIAFTLLVGYVNKRDLKGYVEVEFEEAPSRPLETEKPIRILGIVSYSNGNLVLKEKSMYQPLKDASSLEALH
ncbi:MAG: hypothetical protein K6G00_05455 [Treponema sp.]|nr:hypothetical protein [Treponema sp.]